MSCLLPSVFHKISRSFVTFNRASDPFHPSDAPMGLWELDGWWQPPNAAAADAGLNKTTIAFVVVVAAAAAVFIYRCAPAFSPHITAPAPGQR